MLFPVFLKLDGRRVVVVGGGPVAASKLQGLLDAGARVTVVAPEIVDDIRRRGVAIERRPFAPADLDGAWFVVAAATPAVNRAVAEAAEERHSAGTEWRTITSERRRASARVRAVLRPLRIRGRRRGAL